MNNITIDLSTKNIARIAGVLFILATVSALLGDGLMGSIVDAPNYLAQIAANKNLIVLGALLKTVGFVASAGIAISLYPVLRKYNSGLALGSVCFRLIEGVFYLIATLGLFSLLSLGQQYVGASPESAIAIQVLGNFVGAMRIWAGFVLGVIAFCLGAAMYYYIMYKSKLIPRWLSVWGLIALAMLFFMVLLISFGEKIAGPSGKMLLLAIPIALQEMVLAVWLIVKGFNSSTQEKV